MLPPFSRMGKSTLYPCVSNLDKSYTRCLSALVTKRTLLTHVCQSLLSQVKNFTVLATALLPLFIHVCQTQTSHAPAINPNAHDDSDPYFYHQMGKNLVSKYKYTDELCREFSVKHVKKLILGMITLKKMAQK